MAGKEHRRHAAVARAVIFLGEVDGGLESLAAALVVPVVLQSPLAIVKEADILVARTGGAADADLVDHIDVALRFGAGAADLECRGHAAL